MQPVPHPASPALPSTPPAAGRLLFLDAARGISILLVVLGHNNWLIDAVPAVNDAIASFRMPFFFFVAGLFLAPRDDLPRMALERADSYLKPFAVVVLLLSIGPAWRGDPVFVPLVLGLGYGTSYVLPWGPLWFLPHLWLLSCCAIVLLSKARGLLDNVWRNLMLLAVLCIGGATVLGLFHTRGPECLRVVTFTPQLWRCGLPFSADLLGITGFFLLAGYLSRKRIKRADFPPWSVALALTICVFWWFNFGDRINLNGRLYERPVASTVQALSATYAILALCAAAVRWLPAPMRLLRYIGQSSLFILLFHYRLQDVVLQKALAWHVPGVLAGVTAAAASVGLCCGVAEFCRNVPVVGQFFLPRLRRPRVPTLPVRLHRNGAVPTGPGVL